MGRKFRIELDIALEPIENLDIEDETPADWGDHIFDGIKKIEGLTILTTRWFQFPENAKAGEVYRTLVPKKVETPVTES